MVAAGWAKLKARKLSWGYLRVYDANTSRQLAKFDDVRNVHTLPAPEGDWSIHNTEVMGGRTAPGIRTESSRSTSDRWTSGAHAIRGWSASSCRRRSGLASR